MPGSTDELLFSKKTLSQHLSDRLQAMLRAIEAYEPNKLLNSNSKELAKYFANQQEAQAPVLDEAGITVAEAEAKVDVSDRFEYGSRRGERVTTPGTRITLHIPYVGERQLFSYQASTFTYSPPRATVEEAEVLITYEAPHADLGGAKEFLDFHLSELHRHLDWTVRDVDHFNRGLLGAARSAIDARRARLLESRKQIASLGYPLKQRPDAPRTYSLPDVRRKIAPTPPPTSSAPFVPEPDLDDATYEHILAIMANMVRVMEQSPGAFASMGEQDLRTHFLVQLNGQYEGRATGETFHGSGKTDIRIQEQDKSVFIAECKFWDGPASVTSALDQLLDYLTWRDAKCALLLFNRNKDFSSVVGQLPALLDSHPQRVGQVQRLADTTYRMRLRHRDDPREIVCTVLAFNVPRERSVSPRLSKGRKTRAEPKE